MRPIFSIIDTQKSGSLYYVSRLYFKNEENIRKDCVNFDVRTASCAIESDRATLLDAIRIHFQDEKNIDVSSSNSNSPVKGNSNSQALLDNNNAQTGSKTENNLQNSSLIKPTPKKDPLDIFNEIVKNLLKQQTIKRSWRILPYHLLLFEF